MSDVTPHTVMEKYEFYFLGLTFTLLAASIQTVDFSEYSKANLFGWLAFGVSGVTGLSIIEYLSSLIAIRNNKDTNSDLASQLQKAKSMGSPSVRVAETGENKNIDEVLAVLEENTKNWGNRLDQFGRVHEIKHHVQKYSFLSGLVLTASARAYWVFCGY